MKLTRLFFIVLFVFCYVSCKKNEVSSGGGGGVTTQNPTPATLSISPNAALAGGASFTLVVNGTGFINSSVIKWGGNTLTTTYVSATQLTAIVPATNITAAGTAAISVFTGTPGGGTSNTVPFTISTVIVNNPAPALTTITPTSAIAGTAAFTLTATGSNFINGSTINWNGTTLATTFISATQITAVVPATNISAAGTASLTVFTPLPGGGTSAAQTFNISNPAPVLTSISPSSATAGSAAFTLTATGTGFMNGSSIKWNGTALVTTYVSATQLTAQVPAANISTAGTAAVTVFTAVPGGGTSAAQNFTITNNNPLPALTSISPSTATAGGATFTLTATGTGFINGSSIKWNGTALVTTYVSATQLTAAVPATNISTAGTAAITVFSTTPGGGTSNAVTFTISAASTTKKFLFDATHAETAGNADWVIDEDGTPQRYPTPAQATVTGTTAETYWTGAISSWGIALAKLGHTVETLPSGTAISYGNAGNPQDLSNYDVFVVDEPNNVFTATEKAALIHFVQNGGGLFMVSDHTGSDRDADGWDSPAIWNDLMTNNTVQNNPFGFSIDLANFSDITSNVLTASGSNTILNGSQGAVTQMEFNNGTTATSNVAVNPNVKGLIWKTAATQNSTNIMSLSSTFGTGRVFFVGDSSPIDDGTGGAGNTLYVGWPNYSHTKLFMNASLWLAKLQ